MKSQTKAELVERNASLERENTIMMLALNAIARGDTPDATQTVRPEKGQRYVYKLYGAARAHGGIVVITFFCEGQSASTHASYFEAERAAQYQHAISIIEHAPHRDALEAMAVVARRIQRGEAA